MIENLEKIVLKHGVTIIALLSIIAPQIYNLIQQQGINTEGLIFGGLIIVIKAIQQVLTTTITNNENNKDINPDTADIPPVIEGSIPLSPEYIINEENIPEEIDTDILESEEGV